MLFSYYGIQHGLFYHFLKIICYHNNSTFYNAIQFRDFFFDGNKLSIL